MESILGKLREIQHKLDSSQQCHATQCDEIVLKWGIVSYPPSSPTHYFVMLCFCKNPNHQIKPNNLDITNITMAKRMMPTAEERINTMLMEEDIKRNILRIRNL